MRKHELQSISLVISEHKNSEMEFSIVKQASIFDHFGLTAFKSSLGKYLKDNIRPDRPITSFFSVLAPAMLFRINPVIGVLYTVMERITGLNFQTITDKLVSAVKPTLDSGEKISKSQLDDFSRSALASAAGPITKTESPFEQLIIKRGKERGKFLDHSWFGGGKKLPMLQRVFGKSLFRRGRMGRMRWLFGAIFVWMLRNAFLAAGLVAGVGGIISLVGLKDKKKEPKKLLEKKPSGREGGGALVFETKKVDELLRPSGRGTKHFDNDEEMEWIIPLKNRNVDETLVGWLEWVYPRLEKHQDDWSLFDINSFNNTASKLEKEQLSGYDELKMPTGFHSIKQVVDEFAPDVVNEIRNNIGTK